jgi:ParB family transcriptional regulator, chromosome partitioning protein
MDIINKPLSEIKPYEKNPRKNDDAVKYVAASIKEFGFKVPIIIDRNNTIVAGHTRYKAAKELGLSEVPCIIADDLTDEQIKAFRLADNKAAEMAGWDYELLELELVDITDIDMGEFGFSELPDIDIDSFFKDAQDSKKEKESKRIQCPCCGEWFEMP